MGVALLAQWGTDYKTSHRACKLKLCYIRKQSIMMGNFRSRIRPWIKIWNQILVHWFAPIIKRIGLVVFMRRPILTSTFNWRGCIRHSMQIDIFSSFWASRPHISAVVNIFNCHIFMRRSEQFKNIILQDKNVNKWCDGPLERFCTELFCCC